MKKWNEKWLNEFFNEAFLEKFLFDGDFVFFEWKLIEWADHGSFQVLNSRYMKDKKNVYYLHEELDSYEEDNSPDYDYHELNDEDNNGVSKQNSNNSGSNIDTTKFKIIKLDSADSHSFEIINDEYAKDKNNVYFVSDNAYIEGMEESRLEVLDYIDVKTFEVLDNEYTKDKNNEYFKNMPI